MSSVAGIVAWCGVWPARGTVRCGCLLELECCDNCSRYTLAVVVREVCGLVGQWLRRGTPLRAYLRFKRGSRLLHFGSVQVEDSGNGCDVHPARSNIFGVLCLPRCGGADLCALIHALPLLYSISNRSLSPPRVR